MGRYGHQLRFVFRTLLRSPMFTIVTIATIAIGIGANAAVFSIVNGVLLKPLPYPEPQRLIAVRETAALANLKEMQLAPADYFTFREENRTFERFGIWTNNRVSVTGLDVPEQVPGLLVTADTIPALGIRPAAGRWFTERDDMPKAPETVMLSHAYS